MNESKDTATTCAGLEGCHELEGVMYDLFVHDPACPKSPEQQRTGDAANPSLPPLDESERQLTCVLCGHNKRTFGISADPQYKDRCAAYVDGGRDICGCKCEFSPSPTQERTYCPTCKIFCVLPNHCDNCGGDLVAPIQPSKREQGLLPERIWIHRSSSGHGLYFCSPAGFDAVGYTRIPPDVTQQSVESGQYPTTLAEDLDNLQKLVRSGISHCLWPGEIGIAEITIERCRKLLAAAPSEVQGEERTAYNAAVNAAIWKELIGPVERERLDKTPWARSLVGELLKRICNLRAMIAPAVDSRAEYQRGIEDAAKAMCFRCQKPEAYSVAQFIDGQGGTEPSGAKSWRHVDRGGSIFDCVSANIRALAASPQVDIDQRDEEENTNLV